MHSYGTSLGKQKSLRKGLRRPGQCANERTGGKGRGLAHEGVKVAIGRRPW